MITRELIDDVLQFRSERYPVVTFFLNIAIEQQQRGAHKIAAKDLVKEARRQLKANEQSPSREREQSLNKDCERFLASVDGITPPPGAEGYAVFACNGEGFWKQCFLPRQMKNTVKLGVDPFVRILTNIFDQYKRYGLCVIDRSNALVAEVYMNVVRDIEEMSEEVPKRVRYGGWQGYSEARIKRHVEEHVFEHLKSAAAFAAEFFKNRDIERLVIHAPSQLNGDFEQLLPETLRRKVIARKMKDVYINNKNDIIKIVRDVDGTLRKQGEEEIVTKLYNEHEGNGNAAMGLYEVLRAQEAGAVQRLVVAEGYSEKGYRCLSCGHMSSVEETCRMCDKTMNREDDIVDELIEGAMNKGAEVVHVHDDTLAEKINNIGAFLRFKPAM